MSAPGPRRRGMSAPGPSKGPSKGLGLSLLITPCAAPRRCRGMSVQQIHAAAAKCTPQRAYAGPRAPAYGTCAALERRARGGALRAPSAVPPCIDERFECAQHYIARLCEPSRPCSTAGARGPSDPPHFALFAYRVRCVPWPRRSLSASACAMAMHVRLSVDCAIASVSLRSKSCMELFMELL